MRSRRDTRRQRATRQDAARRAKNDETVETLSSRAQIMRQHHRAAPCSRAAGGKRVPRPPPPPSASVLLTNFKKQSLTIPQSCHPLALIFNRRGALNANGV